MSAREDMFKPLWQAFRVSTGQPELPFNVEDPITKAWFDSYRDWGSPVTEARDIGGGYTVQTFTCAVISWHANKGVAVEKGVG